MIELPKRIGNISDTDYLQEQINSMKHQLDNSVGGSATTIANLSVENLEVKGKIDMGKNTSISWLNIKDNDDVAYMDSVEETRKAIAEAERKIPTNYIPYTTYIDGRMVITSLLQANDLKITGGTINMVSGNAPTNGHGSADSNKIQLTGDRYNLYLYPDEIRISNPSNGNLINYGIRIRPGAIYAGGKILFQQLDTENMSTSSYISQLFVCKGEQVDAATKADYGYHTNMTSNMYVGVNQSWSGNYRSFGYCGRTDFQSWLNSSSSRFKHDIKLLSPDWHEQIHRLYDLEVKSWTYNEDHLTPDDEHQGRELIGIIAEELEEVMPNAVLHDKDGNVTSYSDRVLLNAMLVLLQEQNKRIEELERRIQVEPVE